MFYNHPQPQRRVDCNGRKFFSPGISFQETNTSRIRTTGNFQSVQSESRGSRDPGAAACARRVPFQIHLAETARIAQISSRLWLTMPARKQKKPMPIKEKAKTYLKICRLAVRKLADWRDSIYPISSPWPMLPIALGVTFGAVCLVAMVTRMTGADRTIKSFEILLLAIVGINIATPMVCSSCNLRGHTGAERTGIWLLALIFNAAICAAVLAAALRSFDLLWQVILLGLAAAPMHLYAALRE